MADGRITIVVLRPGLIWGPRSPWVLGPASELVNGTAYLVGDGGGICNLIYVDNLVRRLETMSPLASVERIVEKETPIAKDEAIRHAVELFNDEKYWGAHEVLEGVWKSTPLGQERDLINGMILVAAAFVHELKDEQDICISILGRAMKKLDGGAGIYHGIDLDRLAERVERILQTSRIERFTI